MDNQKLNIRPNYTHQKSNFELSDSETTPRPRRFSLDSLKLLPMEKAPQAWSFTARPKSLGVNIPQEKKSATSFFSGSKYRALPAIGNTESEASSAFENLFQPDEEDLESTPMPSAATRRKSKCKLVRTNTYEVIQPIVVDDLEDVSGSKPLRKSAPPTPTAPDELVLTIRFPDGAKLYGYFKYTDRMIDLLEYCEKQSGESFGNCSVFVRRENVQDLKVMMCTLKLRNSDEVVLVRML